jgi:hypothetical protein
MQTFNPPINIPFLCKFLKTVCSSSKNEAKNVKPLLLYVVHKVVYKWIIYDVYL